MPANVLSYAALADALKRLRPEGRHLLVCVDGPGASGKSTIASCLAAASGDIQVIHLDDFYRPSSGRSVVPLAERPVGADFDLARLRAEVLVPLRSELAAHYHVYDWATDRMSSQLVPVTKPIVVVEGVYSSSAALAGWFDFSIWVECPRSIRLARGLARDGEAARSRWVEDWMPGEDLYVQLERPQDRAALVADGSRDDFGDGLVVLREHQRLRDHAQHEQQGG